MFIFFFYNKILKPEDRFKYFIPETPAQTFLCAFIAGFSVADFLTCYTKPVQEGLIWLFGTDISHASETFNSKEVNSTELQEIQHPKDEVTEKLPEEEKNHSSKEEIHPVIKGIAATLLIVGVVWVIRDWQILETISDSNDSIIKIIRNIFNYFYDVSL